MINGYSVYKNIKVSKVKDQIVRVQFKLEDRMRRLGKGKYGRVIRMARKPTPEEYNKTCLVVVIGMILIGGLGFLIYYCWTQLPPILRDWLGI